MAIVDSTETGFSKLLDQIVEGTFQSAMGKPIEQSSEPADRDDEGDDDEDLES